MSDFNLETIPSDSVIGTSSLRRAVQISRKRSDVKVKPVRGNIETRINKVIDGKFDAVVLAHAGISRLDLDVKVFHVCPLLIFLHHLDRVHWQLYAEQKMIKP